MAMKYDLYENPDPDKSGRQQPLHAKIIPTGKTSAKELYTKAAGGTTFNSSEIAAAMTLITKTIVNELKNGHTVELGEIGTLSVTLNSRSVMDKKEIRAASIQVKDLCLRTSKALKQEISKIELERNPYAWKSTGLNTEIRDRELTEYFSTHPFITNPEYQKLRACKPGMALKELNALITEGRITRHGARSSSVYLPAEGNFGK